VYQRGVVDSIYWPVGESSALASRYVIVPAGLLVSAAVVAIQWARPSKRLIWATVAALVLVVAVSFDQSYSAEGIPTWRDALTQSANRCAAENREVIGIPTEPKPFGVLIRCSDLQRFSSR
jgi:hypothetical protein